MNRNNYFKALIGKNELIIKRYNFKKRCFTDFEAIKSKINKNVIITDNNFALISNYDKLEIFKLKNI